MTVLLQRLFMFQDTVTQLVGAPPVATCTSPAWRHAASATATTSTSEATPRPSTATCGRHAVTENPSGCWCLLCRDLDPGDDALSTLPCVRHLVLAAWASELGHQCRCHFTVGSRREVDGVTLFLDWQPARAKELLKDDILLLLTGESGQLVEDGSS